MSVPSPATNDARSPRLGDSPWFWVYVFSTGAFAALMLMHTKYQNRQGHLERVYRYGTRTLERPPGATLANPTGDSAGHANAATDKPANNGLPERPPLAAGPQPVTDEILISLLPLRVLTGIVMVVSCVALQWTYLRRRAKARACERMGTGSEPDGSSLGTNDCREVPVPILSHALKGER